MLYLWTVGDSAEHVWAVDRKEENIQDYSEKGRRDKGCDDRALLYPAFLLYRKKGLHHAKELRRTTYDWTSNQEKVRIRTDE